MKLFPKNYEIKEIIIVFGASWYKEGIP